MKSIHEITKAVASLEEQPSGKLVAGFTVLAPEQIAAFVGGIGRTTNHCNANHNCNSGNCIGGCQK